MLLPCLQNNHFPDALCSRVHMLFLCFLMTEKLYRTARGNTAAFDADNVFFSIALYAILGGETSCSIDLSKNRSISLTRIQSGKKDRVGAILVSQTFPCVSSRLLLLFPHRLSGEDKQRSKTKG